jgi:polyisoprenoid-binding protein YceI
VNRMHRFLSRRSRLVVPVPTLVLTAVIALGSLVGRPAGAQETPTVTPGVQATAPATVNCDPSVTATAGASSFTIDSAQSEARYKAEEELAGRGANTAIGKTNAIIGQIRFGADGLPLACSRFDVDLRTLKSDEARRDNFLYNHTLETQKYPLATFVLTSVAGLDKPLSDGQKATFTLLGNLTVHGVTKYVAWEATATRDGETLQGTAATTFEMPDFAITPPKVGPVVSLDQKVALEVDLTAKQAS